MDDILRFALLGLGLGALYALTAHGIVLVYRGSGVLNFAHGAIGMAGAYVQWELAVNHGVPYWPAVACGVLGSTVLGVLTHLLVIRPLRRASSLARLVGTLAVFIVLTAVAVKRYGDSVQLVPAKLPSGLVEIAGATVSEDRIWLLGIAVVVTAALHALYKRTLFGLGTTAVAENQGVAASLGWSADLIAAANWGLGSALAGLTGILIVPVIGLSVTGLTTLLLSALAAALVGRFSSFPVTLAGGLVIGVVQSELTRFGSDVTGLAASVPFLVIALMLVARGRALPLRGTFLERLPALGSGRVRPVPLALAVVTGLLLIGLSSPLWADAITNTLVLSLIILSIIVVTGYAGQVSLAAYALAGTGAFIAGHAAADWGWPFELALLAGVLGTVPIGLLFALPAVRTRGVNLAIITLGLGTTLETMVFQNTDLSTTPGSDGIAVGKQTLFGIDISGVDHPQRYAAVVLVMFVAATLVVANVRRSRTGRRLIAVRANERAAAALGIDVRAAKLYAFGLSAAIAALAGVLTGFRSTSVVFADFASFESITALGLAVIGGVGFLVGPLFAATFAAGTVGARFGDLVLPGLSEWMPLIGGIILVLTLVGNQDGIGREVGKQAAAAERRLLSKRGPKHAGVAQGAAEGDEVVAPDVHHAAPPQAAHRTHGLPLHVRDLTVRYGGVVAVDGLSFDIEPGRVVGLIGPNGAGKTSAIDAVTGFTRAASGGVRLGDRDVTRLPVHRRAGAGLSRSFQSLELFEDMSVLDNLYAACDRPGPWAYLKDLVRPGSRPLPAHVLVAIREFGLEGALDRPVGDLSYGERRLLAIARAVATSPSVLLLDEPAAGLSDDESRELAHLVRRLAEDWGMGVLLVEHDVDMVMSVCDEVVVLDFGRRICVGTPEEVRGDPAVRAAYLGNLTPEEGTATGTAEDPVNA
ncbi:ABC-type branched-subunit amino acid transport system ATPase component/branched-subunit amino acid ABC-type transport system permease component [Streptomyces umbrinus]|uniref:ABC-type branched-subunit amino acid transport system ATPase component/branched-subunit amino acid ABC-type transport system permease component n=1 Tax=Streptomyces umbrinus TaxID=67370 RepID=A0ABU0SJ99_9ACTN|nr:branched-chain amino acid ABC transporter permease/ATP-binding protein [Streptomyces umbrinus]MDQ1023347.1 ABC-type branched-subunit amino acid transport system ATPase component/branched-subunit amino acid ABC-type transport system permease component [Streptomyces umbrinus]